jgi:hypothetical protein
MDQNPATRLRKLETGFSTPQFIATAGLALLMFVLLTNMVVFQYGKGVVRGALTEGVRAGAPVGAGVAECEAAAESMLADLLGGSMGDGVSMWCGDDGTTVIASADVTFVSWVAGVPDWSFRISASSVKESTG